MSRLQSGRAYKEDSPYKVGVVKTLGKAKDAAVRKQLEDAARQVEPIMRKREWSVPLLVEFEPKNPSLLGLNVGGGRGRTQVIKVRVRQAGRSNELYPYTHTLGTLLHELVHNVIGAHSAKFYATLDEITQECEELMAKGVFGPGYGFDGKSAGRVGGGSATRNPPNHKMHELARKAAETRAGQQGVMPTGGRRLGGNSIASKSMTPAQAAASAAERRARDSAWCSCQEVEEDVIEVEEGDRAGETSTAGTPVVVTTGVDNRTCAPRSCASSSAEEDVIDLTMDEDPEQSLQNSTRDGARTAPSIASGKRRATVSSATQSRRCPGDPAHHRCWSCRLCTLSNALEASHCVACGTWRFSSGPPLAVAAPPQVNGLT